MDDAPDTVIQVIQLDAEFVTVLNQLLRIWIRAISPEAYRL